MGYSFTCSQSRAITIKGFRERPTKGRHAEGGVPGKTNFLLSFWEVIDSNAFLCVTVPRDNRPQTVRRAIVHWSAWLKFITPRHQHVTQAPVIHRTVRLFVNQGSGVGKDTSLGWELSADEDKSPIFHWERFLLKHTTANKKNCCNQLDAVRGKSVFQKVTYFCPVQYS